MFEIVDDDGRTDAFGSGELKRLLNVYRKIFRTRSYGGEARASSPYELVPNILRYTFNNL